MANEEQLNILKQSVKVWNKWREEHLNIKPDLSSAHLEGADLRGADLTGANLTGADLTGADLTRANLTGVTLESADLTSATLESADLTRATLEGAKLIQTKLNHAVWTGAKLYGTARDDWTIDGVACDYVYFDSKGKERTPKDRDFAPGEFEEIYKQLPTFTYYFEQGFTPLDPLIMDRVVQAINQRQPEVELKLDSFHSRGQAHAVFTVLHKDAIETTQQQVKDDYERRIAALEGKQDNIMQVVSALLQKAEVGTIEGNAVFQIIDGNVTGNIAGQDITEGNKNQRSIEAGRDSFEHVQDSDVKTGHE